MMRRWIVLIVVVVATIGVLLMIRQKKGRPSVPPPDVARPLRVERGTEVEAYTRYRPSALPVSLTFEYPETWRAGEERGRGGAYHQIVVLGPRNASDTYNVGITVRVVPAAPAGGRYADVEALVAGRRAQYARVAGAETLVDQPRRVQGRNGSELEVRLPAKLPRGGSHGAVPVTLKTHAVMLPHGDHLIELSYSADTGNYERYHPVFDRLLESLQLGS